VRNVLLLCVLLCAAACAHKNKRVYDFTPQQRPLIKRALLPYVTHAQLGFDAKINRYVVSWSSPTLEELPAGVRLVGYTIYYETELGFFSRKPDIFVKADVRSCVIDVVSTAGHGCACALAPLFCDKNGRDIAGFMRVVRSAAQKR
jgi:hypothetical protein